MCIDWIARRSYRAYCRKQQRCDLFVCLLLHETRLHESLPRAVRRRHPALPLHYLYLTSMTLHMLNTLLFTLKDSASTGWAKARRGRAKFTKELRNFFNIRVFSEPEKVSEGDPRSAALRLRMFSVAILTNSRAERPATRAVVVARAGTMRPAI